MSDEMEITTNLDQPILLGSKQIQKVLDKVETIINNAIETLNPDVIFESGNELITASRVSGVGLAKLLYKAKEYWHNFEDAGDFEDAITEKMGLHKSTVQRYIKVYELYEKSKVPYELTELIISKNMKDQVAIASAVSQGYEINNEQWKELANAPDNTTILQKIREIKGIEPRKSSLVITLERNGDLYANKGGIRVFIGYLSLEMTDGEDQNNLTMQAVERIIDGAGILRR